MFIRVTVEARRNEHLSRNDPHVTVHSERLYSDDITGELSAADEGHKTVDRAIDALVAQEVQRAQGE